MSNFERAVMRMHTRGYRAFQPDGNTAPTRRVLRAATPPMAEPDAKPIERLLAWVCALGLLVLLVEQIAEKVLA